MNLGICPLLYYRCFESFDLSSTNSSDWIVKGLRLKFNHHPLRGSLRSWCALPCPWVLFLQTHSRQTFNQSRDLGYYTPLTRRRWHQTPNRKFSLILWVRPPQHPRRDFLSLLKVSGPQVDRSLVTPSGTSVLWSSEKKPVRLVRFFFLDFTDSTSKCGVFRDVYWVTLRRADIRGQYVNLNHESRNRPGWT